MWAPAPLTVALSAAAILAWLAPPLAVWVLFGAAAGVEVAIIPAFRAGQASKTAANQQPGTELPQQEAPDGSPVDVIPWSQDREPH